MKVIIVLLGTHEGPILTAIGRAIGIDHDHRDRCRYLLEATKMELEKGPVEKGMHLQILQVAVSDHFFGRYSYYILVAFISCIILYYTYYTFSFNFFCLEILKGFAARLCEDPLDQVLRHLSRPTTPVDVATTSTWTVSDADHHIFHQEGSQTVALWDRLGKGGWG